MMTKAEVEKIFGMPGELPDMDPKEITVAEACIIADPEKTQDDKE